MTIQLVPSLRSGLLLLTFIFLSNASIGQSFFQMYPTQDGLRIIGIEETSNGLELDTRLNNAPLGNPLFSEVILDTDNDGNIVNVNSFPAIAGQDLQRLSSDRYIGVNVNGTDLHYTVINSDNQELLSFTFPLPNLGYGNYGAGLSQAYDDGDILITYYFGPNNNPASGAARIDGDSGVVVWETTLSTEFATGFGAVELIDLNDEGDAFLAVNNTANTIYRLLPVAMEERF